MGKSAKLGQVPNAPTFSASRTTSQSLTNAAWNKVQCATEDFDTASAYDASTNFRFQPTVSGYYIINGCAYAQSATQLMSAIYKNGLLHRYGQPVFAAAASELGSVASCLVYLNGSTDYVELYAYAAGTSPNLAGNAALNYFQGTMARPA
jgi:hypothetical protein